VSYKSILVSIDIDDPSTSLIKLAADLARRFDARLIGCSSADLVPPFVTVEGMVVDTGMIERQRVDIEARLDELEKKFVEISGPGLSLEWRGDLTAPSRLAIRLARMADLIVTGSPEGAKSSNAFRAIDLGDLLMHAGRPVLMAKKALVAWKDTTEARRAVADAVPLLVDADEVVVATVAMDASVSEQQSLADVTGFLTCHGIKARSEILVEKHDAPALKEFAASMHADLIVAGAYSHSRLRELIFGGVTRALFDDTGVSRLMSS
jgi:nucleotide-binding universal stress UspA family protein